MTGIRQFGGEVPIPNNKASSLFIFIEKELSPLYTSSETRQIAYILLEWAAGISRNAYHKNPDQRLNTSAMLAIHHATHALQQHKPLQYVIELADFYHHSFRVTPDTLIPRPETEEMVDLIVKNYKHHQPVILDIGTGSGCIAISLSLALPNAKVWAIDISEKALEVARFNNHTLNAHVNFIHADMKDKNWIEQIGKVDCLVSNPPYIPFSEKISLSQQVALHEPEMALFSPDSDPIIFYRHISELGKIMLNFGGMIYVEIHEKYGTPVCELFRSMGYIHTSIIKDINGKERIVQAQMP